MNVTMKNIKSLKAFLPELRVTLKTGTSPPHQVSTDENSNSGIRKNRLVQNLVISV